jgi:hypothetical protein
LSPFFLRFTAPFRRPMPTGSKRMAAPSGSANSIALRRSSLVPFWMKTKPNQKPNLVKSPWLRKPPVIGNER